MDEFESLRGGESRRLLAEVHLHFHILGGGAGESGRGKLDLRLNADTKRDSNLGARTKEKIKVSAEIKSSREQAPPSHL